MGLRPGPTATSPLAPRIEAVVLDTRSPSSLHAAALGGQRPVRGQARLFLPDAPPCSAVVICPGLAGPLPGREYGYAERIAAAGHAALVPHPYATRGVAWLSDPLRALCVGPAMMLADAFAALDVLNAHPAIGPGCAVTVMGFSYGAMTALLAAHEQIARVFAPDGARFAGHVGYYGPTVPRLDDPTATGAPVLMLMGAHDRNLDIPRAGLIADDLRRGGAPVDLRVLDAEHAWDGNDIERRHVLFSLRDCAVMIDRDNRMRDERTGRPIRGGLGLALHLIRGSRLAGYHMHRNEGLARLSDALLFRFLENAAPRGLPLAAE